LYAPKENMVVGSGRFKQAWCRPRGFVVAVLFSAPWAPVIP
jgi:hypothetical protein